MSRLEEVLSTISRSKNCTPAQRELFERVVALDDAISYYDVNDYEDLYNDGDEFVELIQNTLGIDVSDIVE